MSSDIINTQSGERLSFFKLFSQKEYRIVIPIIQRDYAQGRKTSKEVRDNFLNALYGYLDEDKPNRDLDFVYGSLRKINGKTDFIPLDGQQRLTTLFLLHWYLYQISDNDILKKEFKSNLLKDDKSMFTYETRSSSSEFCDALMSTDIDFTNLLEPDKDDSLSKTIKNSAWFYLSWQNDPTIQSMLNMLDAIHEKFNAKKSFFEGLLNVDKPTITFLFLNLRDFKLTDDLYIKMNSRGKPLTPFENFKAKFEQSLENVKTDRQFKLLIKENGKEVEKEVSLKEYFSFNIDNKWADLFWQYRTLQNRSETEADDTYDDELMNFIRVIFTSQYAKNVDVSQKDRDYPLEYLLGTAVAKKNKDYADVISFNKYKEFKALSTDGIFYLIDALDSFSNGNGKIKHHISKGYQFYFNEENTFENALKHDFDSNHERLCFHAYVRYLIHNKSDLKGIDQWMRIVHNLTHPDNTIIDNASEVAAAIKSIENLIPDSHDILKFLITDPEISSFSSWQVLEEKIKAHLMLKDKNWEEEIEKIEKHGYFNGQIGFILEFAGILDYYKDYKNCDWSPQENDDYFSKFKDYSDKASNVFEESYENRVNNSNYVFERAVLTKGDYLTSASQYRKNLLSTNKVQNNIKRDHSWKRLLRIIDDKEWKERRSFVKALFDDESFAIYRLEDSLGNICKAETNTWRDYFIDCPSLIEYCKQGFIRFANEHYILLYGQSQSNFYHAEMYTYYLWKKYIEREKDTYRPFRNIYYCSVKSIDDKASIVLDDFCFNGANYQMQIYYLNNDNLQKPFKIVIRKSGGDYSPENYENEIAEALVLLCFSWSNEYAGYLYATSVIEGVLDKRNEVIQKLKELI